ncbi:hypothetical protein QFZ51_000133 [Chitinophaga sp. W3I9]
MKYFNGLLISTAFFYGKKRAFFNYKQLVISIITIYLTFFP